MGTEAQRQGRSPPSFSSDPTLGAEGLVVQQLAFYWKNPTWVSRPTLGSSRTRHPEHER